MIIHGPIGCGKTQRALELAEKAREAGVRVLGIASLRLMDGDETIGYEGLDLSTGSRFPMVMLSTLAEGEEWRKLGKWKFSFSDSGFGEANRILTEAATEMDDETMVVADEYGHIELLGQGIHPGFTRVLESLSHGGRLIVLCRTDKVDAVLGLLPDATRVMALEADRVDFWESLGDCFI